MGIHSAVSFSGTRFLSVPIIRSTAGEVMAFVVSQRLVAAGANWQRIISSWDGVSSDDYIGASWAVFPAMNSSSGAPLIYGPDIRIEGGESKEIEFNRIGSNFNDINFTGAIAEIIIYPTYLSVGKRIDVYRYLNTKYRLAASQTQQRQTIDLQLLLARQPQPAFLSAWAQGINTQIGVN